MTIAIGILLLALALILWWTSFDLAIAIAPGWHVAVWFVSAFIGFVLIAASVLRSR